MTLQEYNEIFSLPVVKQLTLTFTEPGKAPIVLTNTDICSEEMSLEESLCSDEDLRFGACESSCFKIRVVNSNSFKGKNLTVSMTFKVDDNYYLIDAEGNRIVTHAGDYIILTPGQRDQEIVLGKYKVYEDVLSDNRMWRDLTCYDAMYEILNADVTTWYNVVISFPMSIGQLRDSFFHSLGIEQVSTTLVNDDFWTMGGFIAEGTLSGKTIIEAICELNGVFGHINREGKFEYISLNGQQVVELKWYIDGTGKYEDYAVQTITGVIARTEEDDIGTSVGTMQNPLIIENNPLVYDTITPLTTGLTNLFNQVRMITYRPFEVDTYGNPMLPLGTRLKINAKKYNSNSGYEPFTFYSIAKSRNLVGIQALVDTYVATGNKKRDAQVNSMQSEIIRTRGKVHKLRVDLDEFVSEIEDGEYDTRISQNAQAITLEAQTRAAADEDNIVISGYDIMEIDNVDHVIYTTNDTLTNLNDGKRIAVWLNVAVPSQYADSPKMLQIVLTSTSESSINQIYYTGATKMTNEYGLGSVIHLMYKYAQRITYTDYSVTPPVETSGVFTGFWTGADTTMAKLEITSDSIMTYVGNNYVSNTTYDAEIQSLQDQIDGRVDYWDGNVVPTLSNAPASSWNTDALKSQHVGDLYRYHHGTPEVVDYYRFDKSTSTTPPTYSWVALGASQVDEALRKAEEANAAAEAAQDALDTFINGSYSQTVQTVDGITDTVSGIVFREVKKINLANSYSAISAHERAFTITPTLTDISDGERFTLIINNSNWDGDEYDSSGVKTHNASRKFLKINNQSVSLQVNTFPIYYQGGQMLTGQMAYGNTLNLRYYENYYFTPSSVGKVFVVENSDRTYDRLESELTRERGRIVLKVDVNGHVGYQELGADPSSGLTNFDLNVDNIHFVANKDFDLSALNVIISASKFSLSKTGAVSCSDITITGGSISLQGSGSNPYYFQANSNGTIEVNMRRLQIEDDGSVTCSALTVNGGSIDIEGSRYSFHANADGTIEVNMQHLQIDSDGSIECSDLSVTGGSINLSGPGQNPYYFHANADGTMEVNMQYLQIDDDGSVTCENLKANDTIYSKSIYNGAQEHIFMEHYYEAESYGYYICNEHDDPILNVITYDAGDYSDYDVVLEGAWYLGSCDADYLTANRVDASTMVANYQYATGYSVTPDVVKYSGYWGDTGNAGFSNSLDTVLGGFLVERHGKGTDYQQNNFFAFGYITSGSTELAIFIPMKFRPDIPEGQGVIINSLYGSLRAIMGHTSGGEPKGGYVGNLGLNANLSSYVTGGVASRVQGGLRVTLITNGGSWGPNNSPVTGTVSINFRIV